jgi:hypothetical protein
MGRKNIVIQANETHNSISLSIKKPSLKYLNEFTQMYCSVDMLKMKLFPNAKKITESFGMFDAVRKNFDFDFKDKGIKILVVGDGSTPRTGATFAFRTKWHTTTVDPIFKSAPYHIKRLRSLKNKIQDVMEDSYFKRYFDLILLPHAHVKLCDIERFECKNIVALPCCVKQNTYNGFVPDIQYADWGIHSPERIIKIWKGSKNG